MEVSAVCSSDHQGATGSHESARSARLSFTETPSSHICFLSSPKCFIPLIIYHLLSTPPFFVLLSLRAFLYSEVEKNKQLLNV